MPVTIKFDPNANSLQSQVIQNATCRNDGVLSKELACRLSRTGAFKRIVNQPEDADDFVIDLPVALHQASVNYMATVMIGTANEFTGIAVSFVDNTRTSFRVTTDGILPNGTILLCSVQPL